MRFHWGTVYAPLWGSTEGLKAVTWRGDGMSVRNNKVLLTSQLSERFWKER